MSASLHKLSNADELECFFESWAAILFNLLLLYRGATPARSCERPDKGKQHQKAVHAFYTALLTY